MDSRKFVFQNQFQLADIALLPGEMQIIISKNMLSRN